MIDCHTHLDRAPGDRTPSSSPPPRAAGVTPHPHDRHGRASRCRAALAAAEAHDEVFAAVGRHPNERHRLRRRRHRRAARARRATRAAARSARPASTTTATTRRAPTRSAPSRAHIELARETGKPLVIHTRAAEDDTIATLDREAQGLEVILHCFSMPDRLEECLEHGWWISFAGNVTYPKAHDLADAARARPARPPAGRDRRALPHAAGGAQGAQPAGLRRRTPRASSPSGAASPTRSSRRPSRRTPPGCSAGERAPRRSRACAGCRRSGSARTASSARTS